MNTQFKAGDRVIVRFTDEPTYPRAGVVVDADPNLSPFILVVLGGSKRPALCFPDEMELIK